jgi:hypothetical protein
MQEIESRKLNKISRLFIQLSILSTLLYGMRFFDLPIMSLVCLLFLIIAVLSQKRNIIDKRIIIMIFSLFFITMVNQIIFGFNNHGSFISYMGRYIAFIIFLMFSMFYKENSDVMFGFLKKAYYLLLLSFIIQYVTFYTFGYYIDYIALMSDASTRWLSRDLIRFSGFCGEPAMYGLLVNCFLYIFITRNDYKVSFMDFIAIATLFLSGSLSALSYLTLLLLYLFIKNKKNIKIVFVVMIMILLYGIIDQNLINYFSNRIIIGNVENTSWNARLFLGYIEFFKMDLINILFGVGLANTEFFPYTYSGLVDLMSGYGLIGGILYIGIFSYVFQNHKSSIYNFIAWFLTLLAAPIGSLPIWWLISLSLILLRVRSGTKLAMQTKK